MIHAFGLTSNPRKAHPPAVDDLSFEARAGHVTALLGGAGAGKTTALKLMLELQQGRGITYFRGRPLHQIDHPSWEVGVLLGDVPGHPARSVRGHLRMLCAASGVPGRRADEVLEVVGLVSLREERLGTLSRGMDRRLGLACALLPDPHTLVLDEPADGVSAREAQWLHSMLRAHAAQGGTVLFTTADPKEAARRADRVVTIDGGRLVADQDAKVFARTRLRPRVAVRSPHAVRLAAVLTKDARTARRSVEVVREGGNRLSVYGATTADVGEIAFRNGILVHQLADEVGDMGPGAGAESDSGTDSAEHRQAAPDGASAHRDTRPEREPAEAAVSHGGREKALAGRAGKGRGRAVPGGPAPEPAGPPAHGGPRGNPDRAVDGPPTTPEHARPVMAREVTAAGSPTGEPGVAERTTAPGTAACDLPAAETGAAARDLAAAGPAQATHGRSVPRSDVPAAGRPPGNTVPAGHPSGQRHSAAAELAEPHGGRAETGLPPADEERSPAGRPTPEPVRTADGERPASGPGAGRENTPERPATGSCAATSEAASATATPRTGGRARGTAHQATASGENGTAGGSDDAYAGRAGRRSAEPAATADTGRDADATASGQRTPVAGGTLTRTLVGTRTLLPGARNRGTRQPQAGRAARPEGVRPLADPSPLPPPIAVHPAPSPLRPLRYEIRRAAGIGTGFLTCGASLIVSALTAVLLARIGHTPQARLFAAWPRELPLPPAALAAGLLGALSFGDEFRHPALAADRGTVPRRLGLLTAKLLVSGATAVLLAFLTVGCDAEALYVVYGRELAEVPADWLSATASWFGLIVGCAWAGVLAAGVFRSTTAGLAAVLAVPVLVVPVVHKALGGPAVRMAADFPVRMREVYLLQWPFGGERYLLAAARVLAQPVGGALVLSLMALLCAYLLTAVRARLR
ncbi:ATP-binding cassette domain-containing protein [Streptomyces naphthomycinicus]|uniref:ATP-binding cassette domain-containing protein n=1 Tax=Streptomyces naphthomycinicus TaxID=2872625 RepID=UPI001CEC5985|nr:ATP-binding cassette domain-containing protein [Streptomyces sp. TML10]